VFGKMPNTARKMRALPKRARKRLEKDIVGKLPTTTGWQRVLPGK
jgi:hypothetical protein